MADSGDIAAWAALAAALLALVVALAQMAQQYVTTAQNVRKCEKSVWGPMPGHAGHRVWVWHQLRFRIVFDMPNIFIPTEYWETHGNARQFPPHRVTALPNPFDPPSSVMEGEDDLEGTSAIIQNPSEASWVTFARQISRVCPAAVRVGLMSGDVDRLPADLPVVPMQVSLRDVIALGLMAGMSFKTANKNVDMSGPSGSIRSSDHPLLGRLLHFTAFSANPRSTLTNGDISRSWLRRLEGIASVANQPFDWYRMCYYRDIGKMWRAHFVYSPPKSNTYRKNDSLEKEEEPLLLLVDLGGTEHRIPANKCKTWNTLLDTLGNENIAKLPFTIIGMDNKPVDPAQWPAIHKAICNGDPTLIFKIVQGESVPLLPEGAVPSEMKESDDAEDAALVDTTENEGNRDNMELKGIATNKGKAPARSVSRRRREKMMSRKVHTDSQNTVDPAPSPSHVGRRGRPFVQFNFDTEEFFGNRMATSSAYKSIRHPRDYQDPMVLHFYWASQIDIELGYWATPWADGLYNSYLSSIGVMVDVALAGMSYLLVNAALRQERSPPLEGEVIYVDFPDQGVYRLDDLWQRLQAGEHTWPPYAINARGGVTGLDRSAGGNVEAAGENTELPPLVLLRTVHDERMSAAPAPSQSHVLERDCILELASIDVWLSQAAKMSDIAEGKPQLIKNTPAVVEEMWLTFYDDIMNIREQRWDLGSGDTAVRRLAGKMTRRMHEDLGAPTTVEQYFVWVAFLRTVKVMKCVRDGPSTYFHLKTFQEDDLVYLV